MKTRKCNFCEVDIEKNDGISCGSYDLCRECVKLVRCAMCPKCNGTKKIRVRDDYATQAQATCGENRTQYKTIACKYCK